MSKIVDPIRRERALRAWTTRRRKRHLARKRFYAAMCRWEQREAKKLQARLLRELTAQQYTEFVVKQLAA